MKRFLLGLLILSVSSLTFAITSTTVTHGTTGVVTTKAVPKKHHVIKKHKVLRHTTTTKKVITPAT